jgi:putative ABC transport system permease protein
MTSLIQDFLYGVRQLRRNPGFAVIAIVTIALGVGVTTAMFSVVNAVLLRPLPFRQPDRLVAIGAYDTRHGRPSNAGGSVSYPDIADLRTRSRSLTDVAVYDWSEATVTGQGDPRHVSLSHVNAALFQILGAEPYLGRTFSADEDQPGHYPVIVSYEFWRTYFNGDKKVIGRSINLNGRAYTVVGVMPFGFQFPISSDAHDLWITISRLAEADSPKDTPIIAQRGNHMFNAIARLRDGVSLEQANADIGSISQALAKEYPNSNAHSAMLAVSELQFLVGDVRTPLLVLLAAVVLVLLIACANVANLLLVRGSDRVRETGVRAALGASRWRLVRQLVTESVALSVVGSALGVLLASSMLSGVLHLYPENLPRAAQIGIDVRVLLFSAALAIVTGVLFGLAPSLQVAPASLAANIRSGSRTATSNRGQKRLRSALVVAETAVGVMLLIGAGLLLRSWQRLTRVDLGFDPDHLLTASFDLSETRYNADQQDRFVNTLLEKLNNQPGVSSAAGAIPLPLSDNNFSVSFNLLDHPVPEANQPSAAFYVVTSGFFETMRMPLVRGRFFNGHDQRNSPPVMVVNAAFAQKFFPNEDPIGKRIEIGAGEGPAREKYKTREVVGVVGNLRNNELGQEPLAAYYIPLPQLMWGPPTLIIRTAAQPAAVAAEVGKVLRSMDSEAPLYDVRTMNDYLALDLGRARFQATLLGLFAGIALLLTAVGLYGVMAQSVAQRTQEIGIRMAMGASRENVRTMVLRSGTFLSLTGTMIGVVGALAFARLIESLLYQIPPRDPTTYFGVCAILAIVALLASYVPAMRATRLDPMVALRYE